MTHMQDQDGTTDSLYIKHKTATTIYFLRHTTTDAGQPGGKNAVSLLG